MESRLSVRTLDKEFPFSSFPIVHVVLVVMTSYTQPMAQRRSGVLVALVVFVVVAVVIRIFGSPLYDMLLRMHGRGGGGH